MFLNQDGKLFCLKLLKIYSYDFLKYTTYIEF